METVLIRTKQEFDAYYATKCHSRLAFEKSLADDNLKNNSWELPGFCELCGTATKFGMDWFNCHDHPVFGKTPCYRERMICNTCGMNNRLRFVASYLLDQVNSHDFTDIYLYEQLSLFYGYIANRLGNRSVIGSEYLGPDREAGITVNGIRHEDALQLSFASSSLDVAVSNDVYEHVTDIDRTLAEAYRVLRHNGKLLISVPFQPAEAVTTKRAEVVGGAVRFLAPARYHGNPLAEEGSLVFYDFGWDLLQKCRHAGFTDAYMLAYYSLMFGYIGGGVQFIFVAEKNAPSLGRKFRSLFKSH